MDFITVLLVFTNWKGEIYDSILVIVNRFTKIVHYEPNKVTIDVTGLAEVIIEAIIQYYGLLNSIISNHGSVFTSKF